MAEQQQQQQEKKKTTLQELKELGERAVKATPNFIKGMGVHGADDGPMVQGPIFGTGHFDGMVRLGMAELRQAASFGPGSVEQPTPPGIFGAPTQGEIAQARGGPGSGPEQESPQQKVSLDDLRAYADSHTQSADQRMERGRQHGSQGM